MLQPILYSFRRCPYAMRARMALMYSQQTVELREVVLKNKPASMLGYSAKGTVPVLVLPHDLCEHSVIDESLDIMLWALKQNDPENWLPWSMDKPEETQQKIFELVAKNDQDFKTKLDQYKYADRHSEHSAEVYREQCEFFLRELETKLDTQLFLFGETPTLADMAILPFIRQFAHVDLAWFKQAGYPKLQRWLNEFKQSKLFLSCMEKHSPWQEGNTPVYFGPSYSQT